MVTQVDLLHFDLNLDDTKHLEVNHSTSRSPPQTWSTTPSSRDGDKSAQVSPGVSNRALVQDLENWRDLCKIESQSQCLINSQLKILEHSASPVQCYELRCCSQDCFALGYFHICPVTDTRGLFPQ